MPVFDSMDAFRKQFTPTDGGYLYYPSRKAGGKLVTAQEYEGLVEGWARFAGRSGRWKLAGGVMLAIVVWTGLSMVLALPDWLTSVFVFGCAIALSAVLLWASLAPRRLVRDRPAVTPPRDRSLARQQARAMLNWRFVGFALLISGAILLGSILSPKDTIASWAWLLGSGLMFAAYLWIAFRKIRDG